MHLYNHPAFLLCQFLFGIAEKTEHNRDPDHKDRRGSDGTPLSHDRPHSRHVRYYVRPDAGNPGP